MGFMDKVKATTDAGLAKAAEAGKAGQAKIDAATAKRNADSLLRDLGRIAYADQKGTAGDSAATDAERIVGQLKAYEAEYGPLDS